MTAANQVITITTQDPTKVNRYSAMAVTAYFVNYSADLVALEEKQYFSFDLTADCEYSPIIASVPGIQDMTTPFKTILYQTIPPYTHTYHLLWTSVPPGDPCTIVYRLENQPTTILTMMTPTVIKMYTNDALDENTVRTTDVVAYFLPLAVPTNKLVP